MVRYVIVVKLFLCLRGEYDKVRYKELGTMYYAGKGGSNNDNELG